MRLVFVYGVDEENRGDRENGADGEDKADRTIKTIKKKINFLLEGCRVLHSAKMATMGST